jgi:hypothetical protein
MPKVEKIRPKQEMDQLPLEDFEKSRVRVFVLIVQSWSLVGRRLNYGKKGEFFNLWSISLEISLFMFSTSVFDLEIGNWIWFAKTNQVVAKNDPYMSNLNQNNFEFLFELILHLFYLLYVVLA